MSVAKKDVFKASSPIQIYTTCPESSATLYHHSGPTQIGFTTVVMFNFRRKVWKYPKDSYYCNIMR